MITSFDGSALVHAVRRGERSARDVCKAFIERVNGAEARIRAFVHFNEATALKQADSVDAHIPKGKLAGLPVGVKDIFDTIDFPTEYNSPIYRGNQPGRDCPVVARLRAHGAVVIGKTETTEFAYMHTGPTRNPHGLERTPGSSSAGSAAGIAAAFFPVALGTQTGGSLIKPASYCGSFAYKPSFGLISLEGVKPLAPNMDTIGWFGRSVDDLQLLAEVLLGMDLVASSRANSALRLIAARTDFWDEAEPTAKQVFDAAVEILLHRGHLVDDGAIPINYRQLAAAHAVINDKEASRSLAYEYEWHRPLLSDTTVQMICKGLEINRAQETHARECIVSTGIKVHRSMMTYDALLSLSTAYEAPKGLAATGTSDFIKTWNALGMPQINVPVSYGQDSMPIGIQIIGRRGDDAHLLDVARIISRDLGVSQSPVIDS